MNLRELQDDLRTAILMPEVLLDLACHEARNNDPFFVRMVQDFHRFTQERHHRFPLVKSLEWGVALCELPGTFEDYFMLVDGAARRNFKKAQRLGYRVERIDFNRFLPSIREIRASAPVRQGRRMPDGYLRGEIGQCANPPSRTNVHDYPYFGVITPGAPDRLAAYAGCMVSGEVCMIEHILGHARHLNDGVVPLLIMEMARFILANFPRVRFYSYGTYFGAEPAMKRFKSKFHFLPHRVTWNLGERPQSPSPPLPAPSRAAVAPKGSHRLIYRQARADRFAITKKPDVHFVMMSSPLHALLYRRPLQDEYGTLRTLEAALTIATGRRLFYGVIQSSRLVSTGWCSVSSGEGYPVDPGAVVIGPIWTRHAVRGQGFATYALQLGMNELMRRGYRTFYIDTNLDNPSCQRVIAKCGFGPPIGTWPIGRSPPKCAARHSDLAT